MKNGQENETTETFMDKNGNNYSTNFKPLSIGRLSSIWILLSNVMKTEGKDGITVKYLDTSAGTAGTNSHWSPGGVALWHLFYLRGIYNAAAY